MVLPERTGMALKTGIGKEKKTAVTEEVVQIVTFQVSEEEYGLDIGSVAEVIRPFKITPLPRMPEFVEGVINLRGAIIPIVDMRRRFELATARSDPKRMRMMITRGAVSGEQGAGHRLLGLLVDGVREVLTVPKKQIEDAPEAARGTNADFVTGMGKMGDRLIILLDITRILSREERAALAEAGDGNP
jgi:purine-binding chemotaxis protein CheW